MSDLKPNRQRRDHHKSNLSVTSQKIGSGPHQNQLLQPYLKKFVLVFLDHILIYSKTRDEHLEHIQQVFEILRSN